MTKIKKSNLFEIGVRLLGIYFLAQVPFSLISIGMAFSQNLSEYITNITLYRSTLSATPILLIIIGWLLVFRASKIASIVIGKQNEPEETPKQYSQLPLWIIIIGLFYMVSSSAKMIQEIVRLPISSPDWFWWSQIVSNALIFIFSLGFIFKSKKIEAFINKHSSN